MYDVLNNRVRVDKPISPDILSLGINCCCNINLSLHIHVDKALIWNMLSPSS